MLAILLNDTTCVSASSGGVEGGKDEIPLYEIPLPCPCSSMSHQRYRQRPLSSLCINEFQYVSVELGVYVCIAYHSSICFVCKLSLSPPLSSIPLVFS